uniref:Uncharacterized protein n=1 Tax=Avena sativa TaxID=4498 RepID=A0ACD5TAX1_AVESA
MRSNQTNQSHGLLASVAIVPIHTMEKCTKLVQALLLLLLCFAIHAQAGRVIGVDRIVTSECIGGGACFVCHPYSLQFCYSSLADCTAHCHRPLAAVPSSAHVKK